MIQIAIDDKACVSCGLCADICPTDVFTFEEKADLPEVSKPKECFGCLSCSEICPSDAIRHEGASLSEAYYHDPYAVQLVNKMAALDTPPLHSPDDDTSRAMSLRDLSVRLQSVAVIFKQTVGGSLPAVGTQAGMTLARHLPRYRIPASLEEALEMAARQFSPAWKIQSEKTSSDELVITVTDCCVREICLREGIPLGSELCVLFYHYLAGYASRLGKVRLRLRHADRGEKQCKYQIMIYP